MLIAALDKSLFLEYGEQLILCCKPFFLDSEDLVKPKLFYILFLSLLFSGCSTILKEAKHQIERNDMIPKVVIREEPQVTLLGPDGFARVLQIDSLPNGAIIWAITAPKADTAKNGTAKIFVTPDKEQQTVFIWYSGLKSKYRVKTPTMYTTFIFKNGKLFPKE